ncbi:MAG: PAS domain S-box protein, partial [bacterium]
LSMILYWLALAPRRYGRPSREVPAGLLLQRRRWWLFGSLILIAASLLIDAQQLDLLAVQFDIYFWALFTIGSFVIAIVTMARYFRSSGLEATIFTCAFVAFVLASYLHLFGDTNAAVLSAAGGNTFLALHILFYYRRFIGLEAELRTGLYDENLSLREENIIQRNILAHTREAVLQLDRDERITYANPTFALISGYQLKQLRGRKLSEVISRNFYEAATRALKGARSGREEMFEILLHRQNMPDIALQVHALPLLDNRQKLRGIHLGFFEITENVQARENLLARIEKQENDLSLYRSALERTENAVILSDTNCRILFASKSFTSITGYDTADLVGRSTNIYRMDTKAERDALTSLQQGKVWKGSFNNRRKDSSEFEVDVYATPLMEEAGEVQYILWVERDASERLQKEGALHQAKQQVVAKESDLHAIQEEYAAIHSALDTGIILVRPDGACKMLNPQAATILGMPADSISLKKLPAFAHDLLKMGTSYGSKMRSEAIEFIDEFQMPDGEKKLLRWHAMPVSVGRDRHIGVVLQVFDITEYHVREKRIEALEKELEKSRRQQNIADATSVDRMQKILNVAENVHSSMSFNESMQIVVRTAQNFGWTNIMIFEKKPGSQWYELVGSGGFKPRHVNALHALPAKDVDQYFQSRFAVGSGFFLKSEKAKKNGG